MQTAKRFPWPAAGMVVLAAMVAAAIPAQAQTYEVTISNLTRGQILSPPIAFTHQRSFEIFRPGEAAIPELAAVAEDADSEALLALLGAEGAVHDVTIGADVVPPGESLTLSVEARGNRRSLSVLGMLVTTNDAFFAGKAVLRGMRATFYAPAWDAGSEANTQDCSHIPGPPCGNPGVRVTDGAEGFVFIHQGIQQRGSLQPRDFDWRNPVARISVRRSSG